MTDLGSSRPQVDTTRPAYGRDPDPTAWTGWVVFAAFMMIMVGCFQAIEGLVALFDDGWYRVTENGLLVDVDYTAWGWTHLLLGALLVIAGVGVLAGNTVARAVAIVLAGLSALVNLAFIEAYPIWAVIVITVDVLVVYALVVHGREMRSSSM
jgi:uncharacterized membrane protein